MRPSDHEIDTAFVTFVQHKVGAIIVGSDGFFVAHRKQVVELAARYALPAVYVLPGAGGGWRTMSYGASQTD